ncbi:hypothetical protein ACFWFF_20360 [Streptomyces sp. NPDC060223]
MGGARPQAAVSGKTKQNAVKSMVVTDAKGRVLFCSQSWRGS